MWCLVVSILDLSTLLLSFMLSLSDNNQANVIAAFNPTYRYQDDLLNIDNPYFEQMVSSIHTHYHNSNLIRCTVSRRVD